MDADLSHRPSDLPAMLAAAENADLAWVLGGSMAAGSRTGRPVESCSASSAPLRTYALGTALLGPDRRIQSVACTDLGEHRTHQHPFRWLCISSRPPSEPIAIGRPLVPIVFAVLVGHVKDVLGDRHEAAWVAPMLRWRGQ